MNPRGSGGNSGKGEKWLLIGAMEPIARGLGLPLPSLGLGFGFGFGATSAGGRLSLRKQHFVMLVHSLEWMPPP